MIISYKLWEKEIYTCSYTYMQEATYASRAQCLIRRTYPNQAQGKTTKAEPQRGRATKVPGDRYKTISGHKPAAVNEKAGCKMETA